MVIEAESIDTSIDLNTTVVQLPTRTKYRWSSLHRVLEFFNKLFELFKCSVPCFRTCHVVIADIDYVSSLKEVCQDSYFELWWHSEKRCIWWIHLD